MNEKKLSVFLLGREIPEFMASLGYEEIENREEVVFKKTTDPANRYRVVVRAFTIRCEIWNDNYNEERWHETLQVEMPTYLFAKLKLHDWALILHLGKQVEFSELAAKCGLKIQEEAHVCAA